MKRVLTRVQLRLIWVLVVSYIAIQVVFWVCYMFSLENCSTKYSFSLWKQGRGSECSQSDKGGWTKCILLQTVVTLQSKSRKQSQTNKSESVKAGQRQAALWLQVLTVDNQVTKSGKPADIYTQGLNEEQVWLDEAMRDRCAGGSLVRWLAEVGNSRGTTGGQTRNSRVCNVLERIKGRGKEESLIARSA